MESKELPPVMRHEDARTFALLIRFSPDRAREMLAEMFARCGYNCTTIAKEVGVARRTVSRWVLSLGLTDQFEQARIAALETGECVMAKLGRGPDQARRKPKGGLRVQKIRRSPKKKLGKKKVLDN